MEKRRSRVAVAVGALVVGVGWVTWSVFAAVHAVTAARDTEQARWRHRAGIVTDIRGNQLTVVTADAAEPRLVLTVTGSPRTPIYATKSVWVSDTSTVVLDHPGIPWRGSMEPAAGWMTAALIGGAFCLAVSYGVVPHNRT